MSAPLYELVHHRNELAALEASEDLPPEVILSTLEAIDGEVQVKAQNIAALTRNLDASAAMIREAGMRMLDRASRLEKRAESIRQYLLVNMQAAGITKIECPWFVITLKKNPPAVNVYDETAVPNEFRVTPDPPPPRIDKSAIAKALKAGQDVLGCAFIQSERIEIKE